MLLSQSTVTVNLPSLPNSSQSKNASDIPPSRATTLFKSLSPAKQRKHLNAVRVCTTYLHFEIRVLNVLDDAERENLDKLLGYSSMYNYAVSELKLSEWTAHYFIAVALACRDLVPLKNAIHDRSLTVSKAARMLSTLTKDNAHSFVEFAKVHTSREIDRESARINPKSRRKDKIRPASDDWFNLECALSPDVLTKLKRVQSLESNRITKPADLNATLDAALTEYLNKHDPVVKAERAQKKAAKTKDQQETKTEKAEDFCPSRNPAENNPRSYGKRTPLTACQKHAVHLRDKGRCTFVHPATGERCSNERWTEIHHIVGVAEGGGNQPSNLRTLCAAHHDLVHQLSLPIDNQVTWLRSPQLAYG